MRDLTIWMLVVVAICFAPARAAQAQEPPPKENGQGYLFAGLGAVNAEEGTLHVGIGGEANIFKGLGIGTEIGGMVALRYMEDGLGIFSVNGVYTFGRKTAGRFRPFVTAGYTAAIHDATMNAVNFGGGVNYWFARHLGIRVEFRDHFSPESARLHLWQGRLGFAFR
jgi:hypothetical protein